MHLLMILLMTASEAPPPLVGKLCFSEGRECVATRGTTIEVTKQEVPRRFVWTSDDHRTVVVGELAPDTGIIELGLPAPGEQEPAQSAGRRTITLSVRGEAARGWPADVRFMLMESKEKRWAWSLPAGSTRGDVTIHLPVGESRVVLGAKRHRTEIRPIRGGKNLTLGQVELKPLPAISGRVTRMEEERVVPIAGAQIVLPRGRWARRPTNRERFVRSSPSPFRMRCS